MCWRPDEGDNTLLRNVGICLLSPHGVTTQKKNVEKMHKIRMQTAFTLICNSTFYKKFHRHAKWDRRAEAQAVTRCLLTAGTRVQSRGTSSEIRGGTSGTGAGLSPTSYFSAANHYYTTAPCSCMNRPARYTIARPNSTLSYSRSSLIRLALDWSRSEDRLVQEGKTKYPHDVMRRQRTFERLYDNIWSTGTLVF
jgi:hypothetical protein